MKKKIIIFTMLIFLLVSPFNVSAAADDELNVGENIWQATVAELNLAIGDFIENLITKVVGQKITIQNLIFNEVDAVNANFFDSTVKGTPVHKIIRDAVNNWYGAFQALAVTFYTAAVLVVGIKILLSDSVLSSANWKDVSIKWVTGLVLLFTFKYIMRYSFDINEMFIKMIRDNFTSKGYATGTNVGDKGEFDDVVYEFRSPEYRSKYSGVLSYGGEELNQAYVKKLTDYGNTADMMRIMRAYAGVTKRIIFVIIWFILLFQLILLLVKYYKRYFVLALLITMFPLVMIQYLIDLIKGQNSRGFSAWMREFFVNVFTQTIHAIIYAIIAAVCIDRVKEELQTGRGESMNWLIVIIAINFIFQGEKVVRKVLGVDGAQSATGMSETAKRGRQGRKSATSAGKQLYGAFKK